MPRKRVSARAAPGQHYRPQRAGEVIIIIIEGVAAAGKRRALLTATAFGGRVRVPLRLELGGEPAIDGVRPRREECIERTTHLRVPNVFDILLDQK